MAAEILGRMGNGAAIPTLMHHVSVQQATVRGAALHALGMLGATSARDAMQDALSDVEPEVRLQALTGLNQLEPKYSPALLSKLISLLEDDSLRVRMQALIILARLGREDKVLSREVAWLQSGDLALRAAALQAFGGLTQLLDGKLTTAPVLAALGDPSTAVRIAACRAD